MSWDLDPKFGREFFPIFNFRSSLEEQKECAIIKIMGVFKNHFWDALIYYIGEDFGLVLYTNSFFL